MGKNLSYPLNNSWACKGRIEEIKMYRPNRFSTGQILIKAGKRLLCSGLEAVLMLSICAAAFAEETEPYAGTLVFPETLLELSESCFEGDTSFTEAILPDGTRSLGKRAFADSTLMRIYIPASTVNIAEDAFEGSRLSEICGVSGSKAEEYANEHNILFVAEDDETDPAAACYRALLIGETAYAKRLNGPDNDMHFMSAMLNGLPVGYRVLAQENATLDELIELVDIAFEGATEDDVSLFYYSGHGVTGSTEYYSGALQTVDYQYITTMDLAELLSAIPGKVIVILDSCGSGATISDGLENQMFMRNMETAQPSQTPSENTGDGQDEEVFDPGRFNSGVIDAFMLHDSFTWEPGSSDGLLRAGELKQSKFHVITSSAYEENSVTSQIDGVWGGVLTRAIAEGTGCTYPGGVYGGTMKADISRNNKLSFDELAGYCKDYAVENQNVLSYSAKPGAVLFSR